VPKETEDCTVKGGDALVGRENKRGEDDGDKQLRRKPLHLQGRKKVRHFSGPRTKKGKKWSAAKIAGYRSQQEGERLGQGG